jgi:hypothetical protein
MIINLNSLQKKNPEELGWIATAIGAGVSLATAITSAALKKRKARLDAEKAKTLARAKAVADAKKIAEVKALNAKTEAIINSQQSTNIVKKELFTTDNMFKYGLPLSLAIIMLVKKNSSKPKNYKKVK